MGQGTESCGGYEIDCDEIDRKSKYVTRKETSKPKITHRGKTIQLKCCCGNVYRSRVADLNRGWGKSCSKRCASIKREYGRPDAK